MTAYPQPKGTVERILGKVKEIAVLPQVVYKVIEITGSQVSSPKDIEAAVEVDPGFCARILRVVNSAYYALPRQVSSIREAVLLLGFRALRELAMTIGAFDLFMGKTDKGSMRRRVWWRHSLDTALAARAMARVLPDMNVDEAHAAALLHDIGKPMLDRHIGGGYDQTELLISAGMPILEAERRTLGADHCEVGVAVATLWRFPAALTETIGCHHVPGPDMDYPRLCALVALCDAFSHCKMAGSDPVGVIPEWAQMALGIDSDQALAAYEVCCKAIDDSTSFNGAF
ncbi:MAG: HDOD domain-containing protein [Fimbriimonadia bacterium]|jgi:putative nucleotidyltransferase with HDIG domain